MWLYYIARLHVCMNYICVPYLSTVILWMCCEGLWSSHSFIPARLQSALSVTEMFGTTERWWCDWFSLLMKTTFLMWHLSVFPDCFLVSVSSQSLLTHPTWGSCSLERRTATRWPSQSWRRWDTTRGFIVKLVALIEPFRYCFKTTQHSNIRLPLPITTAFSDCSLTAANPACPPTERAR